MASSILGGRGLVGPSGRARVGHRYRRIWAALAVGGLLASILGAGPAAAADPPPGVVLDGVVTVHQVDPAEGPIAGATIIARAYRDPATPIQIVTATTNASGDATLSGLARPADGAAAVLLDVRSDKTSSVVDAKGCTEKSSWSAEKDGLASLATVDMVLDTSARSISIDCPEPNGAVLGATGRPEITPPSTEAAPAAARLDGRTPLLPVLLAILGLTAVVVAVPLRRLAPAPTRRWRGGR